jgi:hypothetical protein
MPEVLRRPHQAGEPMRRVLALVLIALALIALGIATAGCTGNQGHPTASPSPTGLTDEQLLAIGRQHSQCLRDHGLSNVTEPSVWRGTIKFGGSQVPADRATEDAAYRACQPIADKVPARYLYQNWKPTSADVDAMGKFANCLRQHGFPDWPNPNGDGYFPIRGTNFETAIKTDAWQEAFSVCQKYYNGPLLTVLP